MGHEQNMPEQWTEVPAWSSKADLPEISERMLLYGHGPLMWRSGTE